MKDSELLSQFTRSCRQSLRVSYPKYPRLEPYLTQRCLSITDASSMGLGYYRGRTGLVLGDGLRAFLRAWGEREAIVFPLRTLGGSLVGVELGAIGEKYYSDYMLPESGRRGGFFYTDTFDWKNFHKYREVVLTEGAYDGCVVSKYLKCVLSCLTATVSAGQFRGLKRWAEKVYCTFDRDSAGDKGHDRLKRRAGTSMTVLRVVPKASDPNDMERLGTLRPWAKMWAPRYLHR